MKHAVAGGSARRRARLFAAAAALVVVLVGAAIIGPRLVIDAPGASQSGSRPAATGTRSQGATTLPTATAAPFVTGPPIAEPITSPGEVQVGELLTPSDGWLHNVDGRVLLTHSGGAAWRDVTPSGMATETPWAFFVDPIHGWIGEYDAEADAGMVLWRTTDAGVTWSRSVVQEVEGILGALVFLTPTVGWLATDPGGQEPRPELRWTHDGGATWSDPIDLAASGGTPTLQLIGFFDDQAGVITGEKILRTSDGGRTWLTPQSQDPDMRLTGTPRYGPAHIVDATTAFVVVQWVDGEGRELRRTILGSHDAGTSWKTLFTDSLHRSWSFVDALRWIGTDGKEVWTTEDGGLTFVVDASVGLPDPLGGAWAQFVDPVHGWATAMRACPPGRYGCFAGPELFKTIDGGRTWTRIGDCIFTCSAPKPS